MILTTIHIPKTFQLPSIRLKATPRKDQKIPPSAPKMYLGAYQGPILLVVCVGRVSSESRFTSGVRGRGSIGLSDHRSQCCRDPYPYTPHQKLAQTGLGSSSFSSIWYVFRAGGSIGLFDETLGFPAPGSLVLVCPNYPSRSPICHQVEVERPSMEVHWAVSV